MKNKVGNNLKTSYHYTYELKQNPINKRCKIVRYTLDFEVCIAKKTIYKRLSRPEAEELIFKLERNQTK